MKYIFLPVVLYLLSINFNLSAQDHFDIIITNIDLIDGTGAELQNNVNIYIKDGLIKDILKTKKAHATAEEIIDGEGKYVIPGLFDAHYHFLDYRARDMELYKEQGQLLTHFGITSILVPNGIIEDLQEFIGFVRTNKATAPRIFYTSRISTIPGSHPAKGEAANRFKEGLNINYVNDTLDIERIVKEAKEEGAVAVKIVIDDGPFPPLTERMPEEFIEKFSREADKLNIPVFAHVSDMTEVKMAVDNGVDALLHGAVVNWQKDEQLIEEMAKKNISWVFTNMIGKALFYPLNPEWLDANEYKVFDQKYMEPLSDSVGTKAEMSRTILSRLLGSDSIPLFESFFKKIMGSNKKILDTGVNLVVGTDTGGSSPYILPGISVHEEMKILQISGLDPLDIIKISTLNAAKMIGRSESLGSIEKGKVADLILLQNNPLEDIANTLSIHEVIKDGVIQEKIEMN
ncbi:MAG: amidohydrolase family protein [Candidatus Cyclobacteriaceae bacterium M2_1C_046]